MNKLLFKNAIKGIFKQKTFFITLFTLSVILITLFFAMTNFIVSNKKIFDNLAKGANIPDVYLNKHITSKETESDKTKFEEQLQNLILPNNPLQALTQTYYDDSVSDENNTLTFNGKSTHNFLMDAEGLVKNPKTNTYYQGNNKAFSYNSNTKQFQFANYNDLNKNETFELTKEGTNTFNYNYSGECFVSSGFASAENLHINDTFTYNTVEAIGRDNVKFNCKLKIIGINDTFFSAYSTKTTSNFFVASDRPCFIMSTDPYNKPFQTLSSEWKNNTRNYFVNSWDYFLNFKKNLNADELAQLETLYKNNSASYLYATLANQMFISSLLINGFLNIFLYVSIGFIVLIFVFNYLLIYGIIKRSTQAFQVQFAILKAIGIKNKNLRVTLMVMPLVAFFSALFVGLPVGLVLQGLVYKTFLNVFSFPFQVYIDPLGIAVYSFIFLLISFFISFGVVATLIKKITIKDAMEAIFMKTNSFLMLVFKKVAIIIPKKMILTYNLFIKNFSKVLFSLFAILFSAICLLVTSIAWITVTSFSGEVNANLNARYQEMTETHYSSNEITLSNILLCHQQNNYKLMNNCSIMNNYRKGMTPKLLGSKYSFIPKKLQITDDTNSFNAAFNDILSNYEAITPISKANHDLSSNINLSSLDNVKYFYYLDRQSNIALNTWNDFNDYIRSDNQTSHFLTIAQFDELKKELIKIIQSISKGVEINLPNKYFFGVQVLGNKDEAAYQTRINFNLGGNTDTSRLYDVDHNNNVFKLYSKHSNEIMEKYENEYKDGQIDYIPIFANRTALIIFNTNLNSILSIMNPVTSDPLPNPIKFKIVDVLPNISTDFFTTNSYFYQQYLMKIDQSIKLNFPWLPDNQVEIRTNNEINQISIISDQKIDATYIGFLYVNIISSTKGITFFGSWAENSGSTFGWSNAGKVYNFVRILILLIIIIGISSFLIALFSLFSVINIIIFQDIRYFSTMRVLGYSWFRILWSIMSIYVVLILALSAILFWSVSKPLANLSKQFLAINPLKFTFSSGVLEFLMSIGIMLAILIITWIINFISLKKVNYLNVLKEL